MESEATEEIHFSSASFQDGGGAASKAKRAGKHSSLELLERASQMAL